MAAADDEMNAVAMPACGKTCTRYGVALPTVSAPTIVPTAKPRRARNHVAIHTGREAPSKRRRQTARREPLRIGECTEQCAYGKQTAAWHHVGEIEHGREGSANDGPQSHDGRELGRLAAA